MREFANGNIYQVGTGRSLIWSNEDTGKTYTVGTSGSVSRYVKNPDGTYTLTLTGHNGFVYFPADRPVEDGGAGAYQYIGRVVLTVDSPLTNNVLSVDATAGKAVDICELLVLSSRNPKRPGASRRLPGFRVPLSFPGPCR